MNFAVVTSFLEYSRLGNDRRQRLSSDFVAQWAATFRVIRSHIDTLAVETGLQKGGSQRVHAKHYAQEGVTLLKPLYNAGRSIRQVEYRSSLYT